MEGNCLKKLKIILILFYILVFIISFIVGLKYFYMKYKKDRQIEIANRVFELDYKDKIPIVTNEELEVNENVIGILEIKTLGLIAPIQEGTSDDILKVAVGHFSESSFWKGNVALASHNRSQYVHYFEKIDKLQIGDEIIYKTKLGTRVYAVYESNIIDETDWTVIENTSENIITLITCVKNNPKARLCVRAKEIL